MTDSRTPPITIRPSFFRSGLEIDGYDCSCGLVTGGYGTEAEAATGAAIHAAFHREMGSPVRVSSLFNGIDV